MGLVAVLGCGCGDDGDPKPPAQPVTPPPSSATREPAWRYVPTLREAVPEGVTVEPIAEVASPDQARLHIIAAVHRADATPALRVEEWSFTQHNDKGTLAKDFDPVVVLRTSPKQPRPEGFEAMRVRLAKPGSQVNRPLGLPAADPKALLQTLHALATTARDESATPAARTAALARLIRGLDNALVLESRGLAPALEDLAAGQWAPQGVREISKRRSAVAIGGEPPREVEVTKKNGGWVVTSVRAATP